MDTVAPGGQQEAQAFGCWGLCQLPEHSCLSIPGCTGVSGAKGSRWVHRGPDTEG